MLYCLVPDGPFISMFYICDIYLYLHYMFFCIYGIIYSSKGISQCVQGIVLVIHKIINH